MNKRALKDIHGWIINMTSDMSLISKTSESAFTRRQSELGTPERGSAVPAEVLKCQGCSCLPRRVHDQIRKEGGILYVRSEVAPWHDNRKMERWAWCWNLAAERLSKCCGDWELTRGRLEGHRFGKNRRLF